MKIDKKLLKEISVQELADQVSILCSDGWDLMGGLISSDPRLLAQWVVGVPAEWEYKLVRARNLFSLEDACLSAFDEGWDLHHGHAFWNHEFLQWMARERPLMVQRAHYVREVIFPLASGPSIIAAQPILRILPRLSGGARAFPSILEE